MTENEMVGWHHQLDGHEFEQAPGTGERQGSLACCSPWGHKESDTTEQVNDNNGVGPNAADTVRHRTGMRRNQRLSWRPRQKLITPG